MPRVEITDCRDNGLRCFGTGDEEFCARCDRESKGGREETGGFVNGGEEERM